MKTTMREIMEKELKVRIRHRELKHKYDVEIQNVKDYKPSVSDEILSKMNIFNNCEYANVRVFNRETNDTVWSKNIVLGKKEYDTPNPDFETDLDITLNEVSLIKSIMSHTFTMAINSINLIDINLDVRVENMFDMIFSDELSMYRHSGLTENMTKCDMTYIVTESLAKTISRELKSMFTDVIECDIHMSYAIIVDDVIQATYSIDPINAEGNLEGYIKSFNIPLVIKRKDESMRNVISHFTSKLVKGITIMGDSLLSIDIDLNDSITYILSLNENVLMNKTK